MEASEDAQAMLKAGELLSAGPFDRIEVWQKTRVVGALSALAPPDEYGARPDTGDPHQKAAGRTVKPVASLSSTPLGRGYQEHADCQSEDDCSF